MKKMISLFVFIITVFALNAQDISGKWQGELVTPNGSLTIVYHLTLSDDVYTGKLDSPDQNAFGIELTSVTYKDAELIIKMANLGAEYKGKLKGEDEFQGIFSQAGQVLDLNLKKDKE